MDAVGIAMAATLVAGNTCRILVGSVTISYCPKDGHVGPICTGACKSRFGEQLVRAYCNSLGVGPIKDPFCWCDYQC